MHKPWVGKIATDSQGILDTLQIGDKDPQDVNIPVDLGEGEIVLDCQRPEWDLLIEIQAELRSLPGVKLQHVQGHKDNKRPYQELDLLGQLNVDADHHAGNYQLEFGACRPFAVMSPLTRAHLLFCVGTVTGRYQQELLQALTTKPLLKYTGQKHSWTDATLQNIHWGAHARAIKRTSVPHTHMVSQMVASATSYSCSSE